jgi:hypothetical protein
MQSISRRSHRRSWMVSLSGFLIILCAVITVLIWSARSGAPDGNVVEKNSKKTVIMPEAVSSNVLFLGNSFWGRYINDWSMASPLKYAYPFSRLSEFHRDKYDAWISGLECPTVAGVNMTSAEMEQALQFNCSPNYLPEAAKWYTAFTLANNHTDNQGGAAGFRETQAQLDKYGIQYFGNYDPDVTADICEVIGLPVKISYDNNSIKNGKLPVAICAYHGVFKIPSADAVAVMKKYSSYMPVVAMPHMGAEYKSEPDQIKTDFYHSLIDGGADMVIGDHPHWIQTSESYKGHMIVYSMGNFMFDQQDTPEVIRSAGINVYIKTADSDKNLLEKWLELGEKCARYKDDCLASAEKQKLGKLDINYKFGVVGTNDGDKIVKPATPAQQTSVLDRLEWQSTIDGLRPPYSSL